MRSEYRFFAVITAFLFVACAVYAWWSDYEFGKPEWVGVVALFLSGLLCAMCGGYFGFVARRIDLRPEDRAQAEIADGAGEIGFFSPGSYWPFGLALSTATTGIGLVYPLWWLVATGIVAILITTGGLLFEYYTGARRTH
jgi:Cytochrome c oxidase subunit IV